MPVGKRSFVRPSLSGAVVVFAYALLLNAAYADEREICHAAAARQETINACTNLIKAGKSKGPDLAALYIDRGLTLSRMNNAEGAIQDYSEAIKIDPNSVVALNNRCTPLY